jgi:hypothetical protein
VQAVQHDTDVKFVNDWRYCPVSTVYQLKTGDIAQKPARLCRRFACDTGEPVAGFDHLLFTVNNSVSVYKLSTRRSAVTV